MKLTHRYSIGRRSALVTGACALLTTNLVQAQEVPPIEASPVEAPPAEEAPAAPTERPPAAPAEPEPALPPPAGPAAEAPSPALPAAPPMETDADVGAEVNTAFSPTATAGEPEEEEESPLSLSMFADAYYSYQTSENGVPATTSGHRAYAGQGPTFLAENGFSLSFLGVDATYTYEQISATASLRFGSSVPIFHGNDATTGIDNLLQGYLTWTPSERFSIDAGMFGTIFGAEVAESWQNLNYTRGALYYYGQPFWHTGLRASIGVTDAFGINLMVVNGTNNISETIDPTDDTPSFAVQATVQAGEVFNLALGGMMAADPDDADNDAGFDAFADVVASLTLGDFTMIFNGDYIMTRDGLGEDEHRNFLGASLAAGYRFNDVIGIALRGEYLTDEVAVDERWKLGTVTGTIDLRPVPSLQNFVVRWDNRYEKSNSDVFGDEMVNGEPTFRDDWFSTTVGFVVHTP